MALPVTQTGGRGELTPDAWCAPLGATEWVTLLRVTRLGDRPARCLRLDDGTLVAALTSRLFFASYPEVTREEGDRPPGWGAPRLVVKSRSFVWRRTRCWLTTRRVLRPRAAMRSTYPVFTAHRVAVRTLTSMRFVAISEYAVQPRYRGARPI